MIASLLAVLSMASAWTAAAPAAKAPVSGVDALIVYAAPAGWTRSDYANSRGADPVVGFEDGLERISLYVYGAPGSAYQTPADFLKGPAASTMGRPPARAGAAVVAGKKAALYRHGYPLMDSDPHESTGRPPRMGVQIFCVLPPAADGRFVVLTYSRDSAVPDLAARGEKAWKAFLKSVRAPLPKT